MNTSFRKRAVTVLTTAAVMTGVALTMGAGAASAGPSATFSVGAMQSDGSRTITIKTGGTTAGTVKWTANGDKLTATDSKADSFGISGYVTANPYLIADTLGHKAPYTDTAHRDLTENKTYTFWACIGNNSVGLTCSDVYNVTS
ncbi:hypothetical protein [Streptomyces minutiscleroticus]|uniref:Uncharacterized protein n=1 Tax=Streptomyces minutiscleroticus TaxID=68238 RepID=A0A918P3M1_9ACTN|nr:hypothetical protein [Streptomyces minutiscleroticus]GGY17517.1 hypothetical protein GCM10010358_81200 [Streptomyces minutiscleroticus]